MRKRGRARQGKDARPGARVACVSEGLSQNRSTLRAAAKLLYDHILEEIR